MCFLVDHLRLLVAKLGFRVYDLWWVDGCSLICLVYFKSTFSTTRVVVCKRFYFFVVVVESGPEPQLNHRDGCVQMRLLSARCKVRI